MHPDSKAYLDGEFKETRCQGIDLRHLLVLINASGFSSQVLVSLEAAIPGHPGIRHRGKLLHAVGIVSQTGCLYTYISSSSPYIRAFTTTEVVLVCRCLEMVFNINETM